MMATVTIHYRPKEVSLPDGRRVAGIAWEAGNVSGTAIPPEGDSRECWLRCYNGVRANMLPDELSDALHVLATKRYAGSLDVVVETA
jgi:hypothetical protein